MHDLRVLSAFVQAARSGSFSAAARVLRCSPGAISKNIARLEHDLGIRLFNRNTRELGLTEEGRAFCDAVVAGLDEMQRAQDIAAQARGEISGTVRVALAGSFGKAQILPALSTLLDRHEGLTLELAFCDDPGDLISNGYDLAVVSGALNDSRHICRRLCSLPLMLVAAPSYLNAHGAPGHPHELVDRSCINVRHGDEDCAWLFRSHNAPEREPIRIDPRARLVITRQVEAVVPAALSGFGITVLEAFTVRPHLASGALIEVLPQWRVESAIPGSNDIYLVYPHKEYVSLRVRTVTEFLLAEFYPPRPKLLQHAGGA